MPVLGIDIGTQSLKAVVLDDGLEMLGSGGVPYSASFPRPGWAEQDPQSWLDALGPAIAAALDEAGLGPLDIRGLAVCGQLDGCVPTGADGEALGPALTWMDRRGAPEIVGIDPALVQARCGLVLDATHMGGKIAWLSRHFERRNEVATWHQQVSFLVAALTGRRVMSGSLASTTMLYDVTRGAWDEDLAALFGVSTAQLPEIAPETEVAGGLTATGAALTGLPRGLPVAVGTGDDFSNPLGCGVNRSGTVAVSLGTAETVAALHAEPLIDAGLLVETHAYPGGLFHIGNPGWLCGGAVRWASGLLGIGSDAEFSALAETAAPGCDGLVFIPALAGAMTPKWIAAARAGFIGLTASHGRAHLARAVLEGTAFAMRDIVDRLAEMGIDTGQLRLMGGGARSRVWCEIRASVVGRPTEVLQGTDASAIGAALLATVAAGMAPDLATASAGLQLQLASVRAVPDERYDAAYGRFRAAFAALEPTWT